MLMDSSYEKDLEDLAKTAYTELSCAKTKEEKDECLDRYVKVINLCNQTVSMQNKKMVDDDANCEIAKRNDEMALIERQKLVADVEHKKKTRRNETVAKWASLAMTGLFGFTGIMLDRKGDISLSDAARSVRKSASNALTDFKGLFK